MVAIKGHRNNQTTLSTLIIITPSFVNPHPDKQKQSRKKQCPTQRAVSETVKQSRLVGQATIFKQSENFTPLYYSMY